MRGARGSSTERGISRRTSWSSWNCWGGASLVRSYREAFEYVSSDFFTGIDSKLRPVNRAADDQVTFEFPVFTVSSVDFQKLSGVRTGECRL